MSAPIPAFDCLEHGAWIPAQQPRAAGTRVWQPAASQTCAQLVDAGAPHLNASQLFGKARVAVAIAGDSIARQLGIALDRAHAMLPHVFCQLRVIPSDPQTAGLLLHHCLDSLQKARPHASKRVLVLGVGLWYNPQRYCVPGTPQYMRDCDNRTSNEACLLGGVGRCTDEEYAMSRKVEGSATLREYERDLRGLMQVIPKVRERVAALTWFEVPPEHYPPAGSWDPAKAGSYFETPCMRTAPRAANLRNLIATPMVGQVLPVVPLFEALRAAGHSHPGHGDCGHYREDSDALTHMVSAVLTVLRTLLMPT